MASKTITFTMDSFLFDRYLVNYQGNRSEYIRNMFVLGVEAEFSEIDSIKSKYIQLVSQLHQKDEEIRQLKAKIEKQRPQKSEEQIMGEKMYKGLQAAGWPGVDDP